MSSSSIVSLSSFNLLFFTQVLTVLTSTLKYSGYVTDKGENITIPCNADGDIIWVKEDGNTSKIVRAGQDLIFVNISAADRGIYVCFVAVTTHKAVDTSSDVDVDTTLRPNAGESEEATTNASTSNLKSISNQSTDEITVEHTPAISANTTVATITTIATSTATPTLKANITTINKQSHATASTASTTSPLLLPPINTVKTTVKESILNNHTNNSVTVNNDNDANIYTTTAAAAATTTTGENKTHVNVVADIEELEYEAVRKINLTVRTPPGPVTQLYFKASTILGFLVWRFNKTNSGGYPVRSFTAEFRNVSYKQPPYNSSFEHEWSRMDPINIAPNVRQMEVYRLEPNTTYEFRIWANNQLGSGDVVTTNVTTLSETKEEDLIRLIQPDLDNFDPRIWIVAVSIVLGTLVILAIGLCIVLSKECYQSSHMGVEEGWDSIELIPNIILNPGFSDSDGHDAPYTRTIIFGEDDESDGYDSESDHEPRMEKFKRKVSIFFTGPVTTLKRI